MFRFIALAALGVAHISAVTLPLSKHRGPKYTIHSAKNKVIRRFSQNPAHKVPLTNSEEDLDYIGPVKVGTPPQDITILYDTGSPEFWLASVEANGTYDQSKSSTFKDLGKPFSIQYGSGNASGTIFQDTIDLAGLDTTVNIGLATQIGGPPFNFGGLMGLGLKSQAPADLEPPLNVLYEQKKISKGLFSIFLSSLGDHPKDGELTIGEIDNSKYTGNITYKGLFYLNLGYWMVSPDSVYLGDSSLGYFPVTVIDSGTSLITIPTGDFDIFTKGLGCSMNDKYEGLCGWDSKPDLDSLPQFITTINGVAFPLDGKDYVIEDQGIYFAGFMPVDLIPGTDLIILGDVFMRRYFTVFDFQNSQIGFAIAKQN